MSAIESDNVVSVSVNGQLYSRWESVSITSEAQNIVRTITLTVTFDQPKSFKKFVDTFRTGARVQVLIGDTLVATGYVSKTPVSASADSTSATVDCDSRTVDLVDCSVAPSGQDIKSLAANSDWGGHMPGAEFWPAPANTAITWRHEKIGTIIAQAIAPYGIRLRIGNDPDGNVKTALDTYKDFDISAEKSPFDLIKDLVQEYDLWAFDDEYGDLLICEKGDSSALGYLAFGAQNGIQGNVLTESADFDGSRLYSAYEVKGQVSGSQGKSGKSLMTGSGKIGSGDLTVTGRYRYKLSKDAKQMDDAACKKKADGDIKHEKALFNQVSYSVQGWRKADGSLWKINEYVKVLDSRIFDETMDMIITRVVYSLSGSGTTTELEVVPPDGMKQDENSTGKQENKTKTTWSKKKLPDGGIALVDQEGKTVIV